jgi:nucleoside 2-deoxyribosyltransferase
MGMEAAEVRVYLAGPEVFFPDPHKAGERLKAICAAHDFEGVFPLDDPPDMDGLEGWEATDAIFNANIDKIDSCEAMIANLSPFRGPGMDAGTAYEIGYASALGKFIVGWSSDHRDYIERVREFYAGRLDRSDQWRDPNRLEVEDFGEPENLMITSAVIDVTSDFEAAVKLLSNVVKQIAPHGLVR